MKKRVREREKVKNQEVNLKVSERLRKQERRKEERH